MRYALAVMPLFDFECSACQHRYEAMSRSGEPLPPCPSCGATEVQKIPGLGTLRTNVPDGFSWTNPRFAGQNSTIKKAPKPTRD